MELEVVLCYSKESASEYTISSKTWKQNRGTFLNSHEETY